jgi:hypothetical protein
MTILNKLRLSNKTKVGAVVSPEIRVQNKMIIALDVQIAAAEGQASGETYIKRDLRWVTYAETGGVFARKYPFASIAGIGRTRPERFSSSYPCLLEWVHK